MRVIKTPSILRTSFPNYIWNVKTNEKVLYLTFDDGPTPQITQQVLSILEQYKAKATFFCIGKNIEENTDVFNQIVVKGHSLGNHTYDHLNGWKTDTESYIENTLMAQEVINAECGVQSGEEIQSSKFKVDSEIEVEVEHEIRNTELKSQITNYKSQDSNVTSSAVEKYNPKLLTLNSKLFRPPYGRIKPQQAKQLQKQNYKIIMWDVLSYDWEKKISKEQVLQNIISKTKSGSIIVFHDSKKAAKNMLYALPKVLDYFSEKGYRFEVLTKEL